MSPRLTPWFPFVLGAAAFGLFASTAARTITWWDGAHYPLLAATLSISAPPGSLLLTLVGWLWTRVRWAPSVAFQLNLLAALFAAFTVGLVGRLAIRMRGSATQRDNADMLAGVAAAGWLACSFHFWAHATQFTPYGLTALFTALLLTLFVRWWERAANADDLAGLALFTACLGLDVSVHRTNQLLAPAVLAGVLLRRPGIFRRPRALVALALAYVAGVSTQLGYLVLSSRHPFLNTANMRSLPDLGRYVRLDPIGGGFLVSLWPRRADFLHVQLADWLAVLWRSMGASEVTRWVAVGLALVGVVDLGRRSPRLMTTLVAFFLSAGLGAVLYFNRPEHFMRPLDRHYLASVVVLAVFVGAGLAAILRLSPERGPSLGRVVPRLALAGLLAGNVVGNFSSLDRSHTQYAERFARDLLEPLAPHAILFTNGDNDTFPLYYLQQVMHIRQDVLVANLPSLGWPERLRALGRTEPMFAGIDAGDHIVRDIIAANRWRRPVYASVTVPADSAPELTRNTQLEGLATASGQVSHLRATLHWSVSCARGCRGWGSTTPDRSSRTRCGPCSRIMASSGCNSPRTNASGATRRAVSRRLN